MKKLEDALQKLLSHQKTGSYIDLYAALRLVIEANRTQENQDPLVRALTHAVLEPLYVQVEAHLAEALQPPVPTPDPQNPQKFFTPTPPPKKVIFVDFAKKKAIRVKAA